MIKQIMRGNGRMPQTDIHADDYALTVNTSKDMLSCMQKGGLDSISVLSNMSCFQECMDLLYQAIPNLPFLPKMSVHLNFVEGYGLAGGGHASLLVKSDNSLLRLSWGGLFLLSYLPWKRREAKGQLKREIKMQIEAAQAAIDRAIKTAREHGIPCSQKNMRIDSHQHAHMIPVVWEALTEVIEEGHYKIEYIRNAKEMLGPFLSKASLWKTYRPVNFVKNILLSLYSHKVDRYAKTHDLNQMYIWGLVMSGHMDYDRIVKLYPGIAAKAEKDHRVLELVFHPGRMLPEEVSEEIDGKAAKDFYLRKDRHMEMDTVSRAGPLFGHR